MRILSALLLDAVGGGDLVQRRRLNLSHLQHQQRGRMVARRRCSVKDVIRIGHEGTRKL